MNTIRIYRKWGTPDLQLRYNPSFPVDRDNVELPGHLQRVNSTEIPEGLTDRCRSFNLQERESWLLVYNFFLHGEADTPDQHNICIRNKHFLNFYSIYKLYFQQRRKRKKKRETPYYSIEDTQKSNGKK